MALVVKALGLSLPDVDTGFRLGVDSILHQNFGSYLFGGHCAAFASIMDCTVLNLLSHGQHGSHGVDLVVEIRSVKSVKLQTSLRVGSPSSSSPNSYPKIRPLPEPARLLTEHGTNDSSTR